MPTSTDSACPVVSVTTCRYVAVAAGPPEYPAVAAGTPLLPL